MDLHILSVLGLPLVLEFQVALEILYNQVDQEAQCFPHQTYIYIPLDNLLFLSALCFLEILWVPDHQGHLDHQAHSNNLHILEDLGGQ